ncbi:PTS 2-O-a-mannosyl-D-glycerate transporter subunit IIABC [Paraclostridium bifermentans]|uniref:PTS 2-O-a-mannosyl-D-glycerate transporter subunit IIABC n=1 Tax=Paraclostridium bifermentans TaxID=1490 RepID=UPI0021C3A098|nr:PTS 2-O-a-mannosyl-D-glycerate transporter subunit IIABC [Paraclostridium bifermentans]GKZ02036.1 PTS 2-O-a-mannosyl-D-glycerate transporter subunit IIABC [Paraclostridium bifermentans]GKZ07347.1 PTS 2-O-a-mannosyl-D-glycerate transporter subunit IIABC [Paraclostridium bifermentans]GKZ11066.1 PTS 2-O-a-mannosyl-D-glycerate transporter subunit IIABC [Paraclostridium bifermentans]
MELKNITDENLIFCKQNIKTKEDAIKFLVKKLYDEGKLTSYEEYLESVMHRETLSPTGFEGGLAIPHGKSNAVKEAAFAAMTLETPIENWESIDPDNKVELVFLIAVPESEAGNTHIKILSELVTRLSNEEYKNRLLDSKNKKELFNNLDVEEQQDINENTSVVNETKKVVLAITACPAGIAHTYMSAEALVKAGKELGVDVYVEKQGANGIVDPHTPDLIKKAEAIIYATDVAPKNTERFSHLPSIKTSVASPLRRAKEIINEALEVSVKQGKGEYIEKENSIPGEKSSWKKDIKSAILTGVSHIIPLIVAGGMILAFAVLTSQAFGLQDLYNQEGSWLWQLRKLSGGMLGTLMVPVLAAYMSYSLAEKPGLGPGFAAGLAADLIGSGFLGGMLGGLLAGYIVRFLKKNIPAKGTLAGFISFWVYPVVGSLSVGLLMLFVVGKPVALLNNGLINWLNGMTGANAILLGAIIGAMVSFDLGGPINKAAYTFAIGAIASGNFIPYAIFASVKMVSAFGVTMATMLGKGLFTESEKEIGKQTWILGLAGITEGAIPFMIEDPIRVIPSLVAGSAVTGSIVAFFNIGLQVPGAGIFSLALLESGMTGVTAAAIWFFAAVLGAIISASLLIITRKQKLAKN